MFPYFPSSVLPRATTLPSNGLRPQKLLQGKQATGPSPCAQRQKVSGQGLVEGLSEQGLARKLAACVQLQSSKACEGVPVPFERSLAEVQKAEFRESSNCIMK